jgi:hypothetical protein
MRCGERHTQRLHVVTRRITVRAPMAGIMRPIGTTSSDARAGLTRPISTQPLPGLRRTILAVRPLSCRLLPVTPVQAEPMSISAQTLVDRRVHPDRDGEKVCQWTAACSARRRAVLTPSRPHSRASTSLSRRRSRLVEAHSTVTGNTNSTRGWRGCEGMAELRA